MTVNGTPSCKSSTQTLDTTVTGTNGTATVSQVTGTSYSAQQTVTRECCFFVVIVVEEA